MAKTKPYKEGVCERRRRRVAVVSFMFFRKGVGGGHTIAAPISIRWRKIGESFDIERIE